MRFLLTIAFAIFAQLGDARANEVDDRDVRVQTLERDLARATSDRQTLARVYDEKAAGIAALKGQRASWARDRKLGTLLAESKDMAARLDKTDTEVRGITATLATERRALIGAIDRELTSAPPPEAPRTATLQRRRGELATAVSGRPLRVPEWTIEPDDDAQDLAFKAAALGQSERALLLEEARLHARVTHFRKQAKLVRSRARADEQDIFHDDEPRHTTPGSAAKNTSGRDNEAADPGPVSPATDGSSGFESPPPVTQVGGGDTRSLDLAADPSVILADVVASGTLDELRKAERSGDPESMARAAERAGKEVEARAARVRALRQEMERRAEKLRGEPR